MHLHNVHIWCREMHATLLTLVCLCALNYVNYVHVHVKAKEEAEEEDDEEEDGERGPLGGREGGSRGGEMGRRFLRDMHGASSNHRPPPMRASVPVPCLS